MIPDAFRTDNNACDQPDHPSPSDLADDNPGHGPRLDTSERLALVADVAQIQNNARRNWYPITRCDQSYCRTTVDLADDPAALCDTCGRVTCDGCGSCDCQDPTPCCPDPECGGQPCTFPGYAENH